MNTRNQRARGRNRREFGKSCAIAVVTPFWARSVVAEEPPKPKPVLPTTVGAMMEIIRARYGKYLTEDQLKEVQRGVAQNVFIAEQMKKFKLANADEPAFIFQADV